MTKTKLTAEDFKNAEDEPLDPGAYQQEKSHDRPAGFHGKRLQGKNGFSTPAVKAEAEAIQKADQQANENLRRKMKYSQYTEQPKNNPLTNLKIPYNQNRVNYSSPTANAIKGSAVVLFVFWLFIHFLT